MEAINGVLIAAIDCTNLYPKGTEKKLNWDMTLMEIQTIRTNIFQIAGIDGNGQLSIVELDKIHQTIRVTRKLTFFQFYLLIEIKYLKDLYLQ